jgi:hypothetical protein
VEARASGRSTRTLSDILDARGVVRLLVLVTLFLAAAWFIVKVWPVLLLLLIALMLTLGLLSYVDDL